MKPSKIINNAVHFYSIYVFAMTIKQIYTQQCQPIRSEDFEVEGFVLIGTVYKTMTTMTYPFCLLECEKDLNCMSINYDKVTQKCELSSQTKETLPHLLKKRQNSKYSTNMESRIPGPLMGSLKRPAKSCLDILVSNHSKGTGVYWLDPPNTGSPLQAYCDMETDGGGWTTIKRMILTKSSLPDRKSMKDYKIIATFGSKDNILPSSKALLDLLNKMGYHQFHFYCYKKTVGKVINIITKNNTAGLQVRRFFTDDHYAQSHFPDACGSFFRLPDDTSTLARNCKNWGLSSAGSPQVKKWGSSDATTGGRIGAAPFRMYRPVTKGFGTYGINGFPAVCDDSFASPKSLSALDTWTISVR